MSKQNTKPTQPASQQTPQPSASTPQTAPQTAPQAAPQPSPRPAFGSRPAAPSASGQQQNQQPKPANPFSNRPAFGSRPAQPAGQQTAQAAAQTQQNQPQQTSRPGGLLNRFGPARLSWEITPVADVMIRFDLTGLGDPFHRLLGHPLNLEYGDPNHVIKALESRVDGVEQIEALLDQAWEQYDLHGALMVFPWSPDLKRAIAARPTVDIEQQEKKDDSSDDEHSESAPPVERKSVGVFRAMDMLLVMNILSRARSQLLLADAPTALEGRYLDRSLVTDDPRLVALAMATGCIEEHVS